MPDSTAVFVGPDIAPNKYRLVRQVGHGGEAQLWFAEMEVDGATEPVAVKILRPDRTDDFDATRERWAEQAELLRFIAHPAVVMVREYFDGQPMHRAAQPAADGRALYLVMNWVNGLNLRSWLLTNPESGPADRLLPLTQISAALDWLHSGAATPSRRPVVHGDISPANIVLTDEGQAVLVDFGLARLAAHQASAPALTPGYAAPEVFAGQYSVASDRYAFGAVTYFLLTGTEPPADLGEIRAGFLAVPLIAAVGADVIDSLMEMFAPDPTMRPPTGTWIRTLWANSTTGTADGLLAAAASKRPAAAGGLRPSPVPTETVKDSPGRRRWLAAAVAGVVLAFGAAGTAFALAGSKSGGGPHANAASSTPAGSTGLGGSASADPLLSPNAQVPTSSSGLDTVAVPSANTSADANAVPAAVGPAGGPATTTAAAPGPTSVPTRAAGTVGAPAQQIVTTVTALPPAQPTVTQQVTVAPTAATQQLTPTPDPATTPPATTPPATTPPATTPPAPTPPAPPAPTVYVHHTTADQVPVQSCAGPRPGCSTVRWINTGGEVDVVCQVRAGGYYTANGGTAPPAAHVWDKQPDGAYVPDYWVDTHNTVFDGFDPSIPQC